jgi:reactive intermediate/imine deaminase
MRLAAIALCAAIAMQTSTREIITAGPAPVGPYSPAVKAGGLIYVSGTLAQDASGAIAGRGDVAAQTRRVIERMREILSAAGSSLDRVVAVTVYLTSASDFQAMNDVYRTFWPKDPPTRTTVITDLVLPDALVEISMIAAPPGAERTVLHPAGWKPSPNPYSYAIRTGDTLFLSGLVSRNGKDNSVVTGDVATQTRVILDNAGELLEAAGMTHANVVSARVYLPDTATFQQMNGAYRQYFAVAPPARATVQAGLAGSQYAVEITMVASSAKREAINTGTPNPNLSAAVRAGNRLYLSGMLDTTPANTADPSRQTRETLVSVGKALDAAGFAPSDIVDGIVYLTDLSHFGAMNDVYRRFFERSFPARATVRSGLMAPGVVVEIMFTAVKP